MSLPGFRKRDIVASSENATSMNLGHNVTGLSRGVVSPSPRRGVHRPISAGDMELIDLTTIICLRKSEVSDERFSVCNVIEKLMEHGIHCLPCSYTNDAIDMLLQQL